MPRESTIPELPFRQEGVARSSASETTPELGPEYSERLSANGQQSSALNDLPEFYRRVLNSPELVRSGRLRVLLQHMLRAVDCGAEESLTERTMGIDVFGRDPDWDPAIDPCVRVAVGRLRGKLIEYYEGA